MSTPPSPAAGSPASPSFAVTSPADILSYVPHALGFMPEESLVVLTTTRRRLGAALRVDLPPPGADRLLFAEGVLSFLRGDTEADATLVLIYSGRAWHRLAPAPHTDTVSTLDAVLGAAGLPVRAGWYVSRQGWRDYFCRDEDCCPWPGQPLESVTDSALNAELVYGGSAFYASAPEAVVRATPGLAGRSCGAERLLAGIEDAQAHAAACCAGRWAEEDQFRETSAVWDAVLAGVPGVDVAAERDLAGFLLASVESRTVRDYLLVSASLGSASALEGARACGLLEPPRHPKSPVSGTPRPPLSPEPDPADVPPGVAIAGALRASLASARASAGARGPACSDDSAPASSGLPPAGAEDPAGQAGRCDAAGQAGRCDAGVLGEDAGLLYADLLAGRYPGPLEWTRVDAMTRVLGRLATVAEGESRAAVLTMSAWFEYARGRGSHAAVFLDAADQAVPGYRLARLLRELLCRGGMPAWARTRATAWTAGGGRSSRTAA